MTTTFKPYSERSKARRALVDVHKLDKAATENYLAQVDGKHGFYLDADGKPVFHFEHQGATLLPGDKIETPEPVQAEPEPEVEVGPSASAFGAFAMSQLTATDSAAQPVAQHTSSAVQRTSAGVKIDKDRIEANGVKERSRGGLCRLVWDALDEMREADQTTIPTVADIKKRATEKGWNINNASIEYYQWRKFNGIKGRTKKA